VSIMASAPALIALYDGFVKCIPCKKYFVYRPGDVRPFRNCTRHFCNSNGGVHSLNVGEVKAMVKALERSRDVHMTLAPKCYPQLPIDGDEIVERGMLCPQSACPHVFISVGGARDHFKKAHEHEAFSDHTDNLKWVRYQKCAGGNVWVTDAAVGSASPSTFSTPANATVSASAVDWANDFKMSCVDSRAANNDLSQLPLLSQDMRASDEREGVTTPVYVTCLNFKYKDGKEQVFERIW